MIPIVTGILAAAAAYALTRRWLAERSARARLTDDVIRQIEEHGRVELDEPLDLEEAREEERRFWEGEEWDEADEL